jgi:hypothetical protein
MPGVGKRLPLCYNLFLSSTWLGYMGKEKQEQRLHEGGLLALEVKSLGNRMWLGPTWAVVCGAVASGGLEIGWRAPLVVLLAIVLADAVLGSVWTLATSAGRWRLPKTRRGNPGGEAATPTLPYTLPGSAGGRFSSFVGHALHRWRYVIWPRVGTSIAGMGFLSLVALLMGAFLGIGPFVVTAIAVGIAGAGLVDARSGGTRGVGLASCVLAGLPWLIGYTALGGSAVVEQGLVSSLRFLLWPALYATTWYAYRLLGEEQSQRGAVLLGLAQVVVVALLVAVREPIMAGAVALFLLPQLLLQPALLREDDGLWYLRHSQVFAMCAMMAMAVAV